MLIRNKLKEIMMSVDIDEVTSKFIRQRLEQVRPQQGTLWGRSFVLYLAEVDKYNHIAFKSILSTAANLCRHKIINTPP